MAMPKYTCGSLKIGRAKQNIPQLKAFTIKAITLVNLDPPLSRATKFNKPEKIIAIPAPTNQSVSVFMCKGNAKLICTIPRRIMIPDTILIRLCTTGLIHLYRRAFDSPVATENTAISGKWLQDSLTIFALIKILTGICRHSFFLTMPTMRTGNY
jgi:hypothetical protein